jgi:predicted N-acetyltransferase YhbS
MTTPLVRPERAEDAPRVRAVLQAAFGGTVEADVVDKLRASGDIVWRWSPNCPTASPDTLPSQD